MHLLGYFLDITGTTNLDLSISGRDTVYISGKIEPEDVNVFYEFATEDIGTAIVKDQGTTMSYDLNIPLRNRASFSKFTNRCRDYRRVESFANWLSGG